MPGCTYAHKPQNQLIGMHPGANMPKFLAGGDLFPCGLALVNSMFRKHAGRLLHRVSETLSTMVYPTKPPLLAVKAGLLCSHGGERLSAISTFMFYPYEELDNA
jgi:hypothetical protein